MQERIYLACIQTHPCESARMHAGLEGPRGLTGLALLCFL